MQYGVITGLNKDYEWLLPWWWDHYSKHNQYPVAFFDFGMSEEGKKFCKQRGLYFEISEEELSLHTDQIDQQNKEEFENMYGKERVWEVRSAWFKKPLAALKTPFDVTVWLDLDCEVKKSLDGLFALYQEGNEIYLCEEAEWIQVVLRLFRQTHLDELNYNSGVILFKKNAQVIQDWVTTSLINNQEFAGDQEALSRSIYLNRSKVSLIPPIYNYQTFGDTGEDVHIFHYAGIEGKCILKGLVEEYNSLKK